MEEVFNTYVNKLTNKKDKDSAKECQQKVPCKLGGNLDNNTYK